MRTPFQIKIGRTLILLFILLLQSAAAASDDKPVEIQVLYMVQSGYQPDAIIDRTRQYMQSSSNRVKLHFVEYKELLDHIRLGVKQNTYDVVLADVIWIERLVADGSLLPLPPELSRQVRAGMVSQIVEPFDHDNSLYAFPFFVDFQLLFSNMRILEEAGFSSPPRSVEEIISMAQAIKDQGILTYPIFDSLIPAEVLICELIIWAGAFGGDSNPLGSDSEIRVNSPSAREALLWLQSCFRSGLINPYSLEADEVFSAEVFLAEDSAFTTNWLFLLGKIRNSDKAIRDYSQPTLIPVSGKYRKTSSDTSSVNGIQGLSVLSSSSIPDESWDYISFMSEMDFHTQYPDELAPWSRIWDENPGMDPYLNLKIAQLSGLRDRPSHENYQEISIILQKWIHTILTEQLDPHEGLERAQEEIDTIIDSRKQHGSD
jgi:multiple sugar transport system substrate-binding protein